MFARLIAFAAILAVTSSKAIYSDVEKYEGLGSATLLSDPAIITPTPSLGLSDPEALTCTTRTVTLIGINLPVPTTTSSCTEELTTTVCFPVTTSFIPPRETTVVTVTSCSTAAPSDITACCSPDSVPITPITTAVSPPPTDPVVL